MGALYLNKGNLNNFMAKERKSSGIAVVLSFLIPVLGQIYVGNIGKGVLLILLGFIFGLLSFLLIGLPFLLIIWVYSMYDAYKTAEATWTGKRR